MTREEIKSSILKILRTIAPEVPSASVRADAPLREQLEIDSMDFLNFAIRLHKEFGIEVPESDYKLLDTLDNCVAYVEKKRGKDAGSVGEKNETKKGDRYANS
ncbi:MAG: acyl carrier protein [Bdellovibrionota bacterium]